MVTRVLADCHHGGNGNRGGLPMNVAAQTIEAFPDAGKSGKFSFAQLLPSPEQLWIIFRRNVKLFSAVFVLTIVLVAIRVATLTPTYSATASVLLQPRNSQIINVRSVVPDLAVNSDVVDTEVRMLTSMTLARRVYDVLSARRAGAPIPAPDRVLNTQAQAARDKEAQKLLDAISVKRSGLTFVIDISAYSSEAEKAADIANTFALEYVNGQMREKVNATRGARDWLGRRMNQLRAEAAQADAKLQGFKIANGLMSANGATMAEQEASTLNQQIADARTDLAEKESRLAAARAQIQRGGAGGDVGQALDSGTITSLRQREADASRRLAELKSRYGDRHPDVRDASNELADARLQIQSEINRIISRMQSEVVVAQSRLDAINKSQGAAQRSLAANNRAQVGYLELQRKADAARLIYEAFLSRSKETAAQEGLQHADARVSAISSIPTAPVFPNYKLVTLFTPIAALAFAGGAVLIAEYLQFGLRTKHQVENRLRVRYAGAVPDLKSTLGRMRSNEAPHDYILSHPHSSFTEAFRSLRAYALLARRGDKLSIAITSALPKEGKTTTAVCLARTAAMSGSKVILVDCDLRRHGSSTLLGVQGNALSDFLAGTPLEEAVQIDPATGLAILGNAASLSDGSDPLAGDEMVQVIQQLKEHYNLVVLDTAPVLGIADARAVAIAADAVLVAVQWGKTPPSAAEAAIEMLDDAKARIAGVMFTRVDIRKYASTGSEDVYGHHKRFAGYYRN